MSSAGKGFAILLTAVLIAVLLALPQLYPALELTGLSNRGGGFNPQQAMAFSWTPLLAGRGLLPSYDAQVFGEYVAYLGVTGLALALLGALTAAGDRRRWTWLVLAGVGVLLAFGAYNPLYWTLAGLPGFNLFRVPARWLALFAVGAAMLAGLGVEALLMRKVGVRAIIVTCLAIAGIALSTLLSDRAANEVDGAAVPGVTTFALWGAALIGVSGLWVLRSRVSTRLMTVTLVLLVCGELWLASRAMPYNDLADPAAYHDARMTAYQVSVLHDAECGSDTNGCAPGRLLSISNGFFDPGDNAGLSARYAALGMTERASRYAFTAAKLKELIAPNLPLVRGLPSIDGYGGGVTPTGYYTQFTSLLLPDGMPRTLDGRLRELLAQPNCNGACLPPQRWLDLMNVRYLIVDKTYDLSHEGIRYDTTFPFTDSVLPVESDFVATRLHVLYSGDSLPQIGVFGGRDVLPLPVTDGGTIGDFRLATAALPSAQTVSGVQFAGADSIRALTLVDARTGDFATVPLSRVWRLVLSSDIKLYQTRAADNAGGARSAFVVSDVRWVADDWDSTEAALDMMRDPAFDPARMVILAGEPEADLAQTANVGRTRRCAPTSAFLCAFSVSSVPSGVQSSTLLGSEGTTLLHYTPTRIEISVRAAAPGVLVLPEAYFPGWRATVDGKPAILYRANVMFRAVRVPAGHSTVVIEYAPDWLTWVFPVGGAAWLVVMGVVVTIWLGFGGFWNKNARNPFMYM